MAPGINDQFHNDALPVVGQVLAGRSWRAYSDGVLTGVTYGHEWTVTGNAATCPYIGVSGPLAGGENVPAAWRNTDMLYPHGKALTMRHKPGAMGCACGFWMYHDLSHSADWAHIYQLRPTVTGLVQGWGTMTRGTKGYRAQFAAILALVEPTWAQQTDRKVDRKSVV